MCFFNPDEVEENRFMWCCGFFERSKTRDEKVIKVDIKLDEQFVACGKRENMEDTLKNICGILSHRGKGRGGSTYENT